MDAGDFFSGADNTSLQPALGSNFCVRPQNCVFEDGVRADATVWSDNGAAAQFGAGINNCAAGYALWPFAHFNEMRPPILSQNRAVHIEIFGARRNIEPFSVVHHQTTDPAALAYPTRNDRNEGDFFLRRNSLENRRIPNSDVGE